MLSGQLKTIRGGSDGAALFRGETAWVENTSIWAARPTRPTCRKKRCVACGLSFAWRRKWARDWDQVRFCSDRCRAAGAAPERR
ncbi:DUF2256 domain-containing protein [Brevundimonas mediterranea]|uniref:DUF2256 domain-containing protein n=1 Tax=Brevundimonas mediterranea TaxID=74329 RepID=UPI004034CBE7